MGDFTVTRVEPVGPGFTRGSTLVRITYGTLLRVVPGSAVVRLQLGPREEDHVVVAWPDREVMWGNSKIAEDTLMGSVVPFKLEEKR